MKAFFRSIHLYLSLAAGLVIMTCCFTGAMLVFEKDLQEWSHYNRYFVKQKDVRLPVEQLVSNVKRAYPTATIASVKIYPNPERSVEIGISLPVKNAEKGVEGKEKGTHANTAGNSATNNSMPGGKEMHSAGPAGGRPTHTVFINPYTGRCWSYTVTAKHFFTRCFPCTAGCLVAMTALAKPSPAFLPLYFYSSCSPVLFFGGRATKPS